MVTIDMDDDPRTKILEATYRALCRCGYANLTIAAIAGVYARQLFVDHSPERLSETMMRYADGHLLADETAEVVR